jgi:hypothetical protein
MIPYNTVAFRDVSEEHTEVFVVHADGNNLFCCFKGEELLHYRPPKTTEIGVLRTVGMNALETSDFLLAVIFSFSPV